MNNKEDIEEAIGFYQRKIAVCKAMFELGRYEKDLPTCQKWYNRCLNDTKKLEIFLLLLSTF
jgi:hypothetical protein